MDECIIFYSNPDKKGMQDFYDHFCDPEQNGPRLAEVSLVGKSLAESDAKLLIDGIGKRYLVFGQPQIGHEFYRFHARMWENEEEPGMLEGTVYTLVSAISKLSEDIDMRAYGISHSEKHYFFVKGNQRNIVTTSDAAEKLNELKEWFSEGLPKWLKITDKEEPSEVDEAIMYPGGVVEDDNPEAIIIKTNDYPEKIIDFYKQKADKIDEESEYMNSGEYGNGSIVLSIRGHIYFIEVQHVNEEEHGYNFMIFLISRDEWDN